MTDTQEQPPKPGGKGRPTPKRSEAVKARKQPLVAPKGVKGKAANAADKAERAELRKKMREALRTGDEKYYPPMAAGPERAVVRDVVDARRSYGWLAIPMWLFGVALSLIPTAPTRTVGSLVLPVVLVMLVSDSLAASRAVKAALAKRFPGGTEQPRRGLVWYGVARNTQFRRQRLPRPRVERGTDLGL